MLEAKDELQVMFGKAMGEWAYNGIISYWAKPPKPSEAKPLTYEQYRKPI